MAKLFQDIIGYDNVKKSLERILDVLNHREKYLKIGSTIPHGLFLYGPPGLGKSTFALDLLKYVENRTTYIVRKNKSDGEFMNYVTDIFKEAKEKQPSIILLDDLDKFSEEDSEICNNEEFVTIQSLIDNIKNDDVFVVATANNKHILPSSLLRAGRFDIKIKIDYPTEEEALKIFKYYLKKKKVDENVNIKNISYILGCSSCADLEKVCNQAGLYAGFHNKKEIGLEEILRASLELAYDTNIEECLEDDEYSIQVAYHEAGHALIGELLEHGSISFITIAKTDSDTRGFTKYHTNDNYFYDIQFMENRILSLLAGKAAIDIVFHKCDIGSKSDIERAYKIAERFIDQYCMFGFDSYLDEYDCHSDKLIQSKNDRVIELLTKYYNKVKEKLIANRHILDHLATKLEEKKILFQDEIRNTIYNS